MIGGCSTSSTHLQQQQQQRDVSLVEQKRMQWAKEREEMDRIGTEMFAHSQSTQYEKTSIKTYYSNVDLSSSSSMSHFDEPRLHPFPHPPKAAAERGGGVNSNYFFPAAPSQSNVRSMRSPSLPPIEKDKFYNYPSQTLVINAGAVDTGYNSETSPLNEGPAAEVWTNDDDGRGSNKTVTIHHSRPQFFDNGNRLSRVDVLSDSMPSPGYPQFTPNGGSIPLPHHHMMGQDRKPLGTPNSLSSGQTFSTAPSGQEFRTPNQRRKWSDNFDPMTRSLDSRTSQNVPYWLEKGLHEIRDSEDESIRDFSRSHIRGQNIPVDPNILAERVGRRRKAMELQNAIKEQLLEQERLKKWEKEQRLQEERVAEQRMLQQLEAEKQRLEFEKRVQEEKAENERRKQEIMRLAVEKAELEAKLEKEKRRKHLKEANEDHQDQYSRPVQQNRVTHSPAMEFINQHGHRTTEDKSREELLTATPAAPEKQNMEPPPAAAIITPRAALPQELISTNKPTDIDGIALVLQSMTPMVPMANMNIGHDLLGLNNSVNNLQFALLLAQQQQQLNLQARQINTISSASSVLSTTSSGDGTSPNTVREEIIKKGSDAAASPNQTKSKNDETPGTEEVSKAKECEWCSRIHGLNREGKKEKSKEAEKKPESPKINSKKDVKEKQFEEEIVEKITPQLGDEKRPSSPEPILTLEVPKLPSDGTFIKEESDAVEELKLDVEISTQTENELSSSDNSVVSWENPRILTPRKYRVSSAVKSLVPTNEVAIQTDLLLLQNCNICSHKQQMVLKEISQVTTSVTQTSSRRHPALSPLRSPYLSSSSSNSNKEDPNPLTTTTVTTTTTIRAKAKGNNERRANNHKKEPRPKWGVNRPSVQYVKASDRDPFCLRRRKKNMHRGKLYSMDDEEEVNQSPAKIDSGVSSTISMHSLDLQEEEEDVEEAAPVKVNARNMCTEILPITTDGNGQIFVNFREARYVMKDELAMRQGSQQNNTAVREKIMEKRSEDLPIIPSLFRTERKLVKSISDSEYAKGGANFFEGSKIEKEEINFSKRNDM